MKTLLEREPSFLNQRTGEALNYLLTTELIHPIKVDNLINAFSAAYKTSFVNKCFENKWFDFIISVAPNCSGSFAHTFSILTDLEKANLIDHDLELGQHFFVDIFFKSSECKLLAEALIKLQSAGFFEDLSDRHRNAIINALIDSHKELQHLTYQPSYEKAREKITIVVDLLHLKKYKDHITPEQYQTILLCEDSNQIKQEALKLAEPRYWQFIKSTQFSEGITLTDLARPFLPSINTKEVKEEKTCSFAKELREELQSAPPVNITDPLFINGLSAEDIRNDIYFLNNTCRFDPQFNSLRVLCLSGKFILQIKSEYMLPQLTTGSFIDLCLCHNIDMSLLKNQALILNIVMVASLLRNFFSSMDIDDSVLAAHIPNGKTIDTAFKVANAQCQLNMVKLIYKDNDPEKQIKIAEATTAFIKQAKKLQNIAFDEYASDTEKFFKYVNMFLYALKEALIQSAKYILAFAPVGAAVGALSGLALSGGSGVVAAPGAIIGLAVGGIAGCLYGATKGARSGAVSAKYSFFSSFDHHNISTAGNINTFINAIK